MSSVQSLEARAKRLLARLQKKAQAGLYENFGQRELRQFDDDLRKADISYTEHARISQWLSDKIDEISLS